jgi:hypothetical protein
MYQKLPEVSVVSWAYKEMRAFYAQFCVFAVRVVKKPRKRQKVLSIIKANFI